MVMEEWRHRLDKLEADYSALAERQLSMVFAAEKTDANLNTHIRKSTQFLIEQLTADFDKQFAIQEKRHEAQIQNTHIKWAAVAGAGASVLLSLVFIAWATISHNWHMHAIAQSEALTLSKLDGVKQELQHQLQDSAPKQKRG